MPAEFTVAVAIDAVGSGVFLPISLLFFTRVSDLSLPLVGTLTTVGTLVSLPVPVLIGHLADRHRPRDLVIAGQVLQAAGFAGYLLARDPVAVCLVIAIVAVGQRVFWSSFFTMIAALPVGRRLYTHFNNTNPLVRDQLLRFQYEIQGVRTSFDTPTPRRIAASFVTIETETSVAMVRVNPAASIRATSIAA